MSRYSDWPYTRGGLRDDSRWVDPSRTRERSAYPYSYDEFFIHGDREAKAGCSGDYSDRLWQWDREKASRLWKQHVGDKRWSQARLPELSAFLTDYHGKPLKAVALAEGCNPLNGYPYWIVWWREAKAKPASGSEPFATSPQTADDASGMLPTTLQGNNK